MVHTLSWKNMSKVILASLSAQTFIQETIKLIRDRYSTLMKLKEQDKYRKSQDLWIEDKGIIWIKGRLCIPNIDNLRQEVMSAAHKSKFYVHPGSKKMYRGLNENPHVE